MAITIQKLKTDELSKFIELINLFERVFDREGFQIPSSTHLRHVLTQPNFAVFAALSNDKVIAGLTVYTLPQYYSEKPIAFIYDVAVDVPFQRQGVGSKLIASTRAYYQTQGFREIFVQADEEDHHAVDFYRSTHTTRETRAIDFTYQLASN